uniref:PR domain zinc finger protein 10 n=1 Tax=Strigamia maritima TaxID=126957 RepID=T1J3M9_STRMM
MALRQDDFHHPAVTLANEVETELLAHHHHHMNTIAMSRPRRQLHKQRMTEQEQQHQQQQQQRNNRIIYTNKDYWCDECNLMYEEDCPQHRIQSICDKPVLSRAWASLPVGYLAINKVGVRETGEAVFGVFAKKPIPKRSKFGPVEGVVTKMDEVIQDDLVLQIEAESGEIMHLDTTDESMSNWMRFVRPAENYSEQNLVVVQSEQSLYFFTTCHVYPRTELKVGYSQQYAERRGLKIVEPDEEELKAMEDQENAWPCFECNKRFSSSVDLQKHLNEHDSGETNPEDEMSDSPPRKKGRPRGRPAKKAKGRTPKKFKNHDDVALDSLEEASNEAAPPPPSSKRPRGRPPKKFKNSMLELDAEDSENSDSRHVRRHKTRSDSEQLARPIKSLFKKKQAEGTEWLCTHCDLTFDNSSLLNLHTLTHAAENIGLEEVARFAVEPDFSIKNGVSGDDDMKGEFSSDLTATTSLKCPQCTQEFDTKKDLIEHAGAHGKMVMRRSFRGMINPAKPFKCELCYKSFASEERLLRHNLVHGSEDTKPLQCEICFKRFLNNSALACHIKVHSNDEKKYYECPICKEGFDQIILLKDHVHIHCISGIYTCPSCQKGFEEYNQIRKHIRAFHSEKRYPCDQCDKVFPRPDKLKLHMLRHSDHREFLCANCGKQFKRKDKLKEHMKRMHSAEREARLAMKPHRQPSSKKFIPKVSPTDYHRFIYKCHSCLLGFKRRGMLVNHLAKRHPEIRPDSVPELNLPILKTTRDYYCQYCEKVYKSSSKRKAHILKNHPGAELPMSNRRKGGIPDIPGLPNPTFSQTVGSITTHPHNCDWCHKQYASKAKLLQHQRKKHLELLPQVESGCFSIRQTQQIPRTHHREVNGQYHVEISTNTGASESDYVDGVVETIVDSSCKRKLSTPAPRPPSVYMERDSSTPTMPSQSAGEDLLTQAMSELTQTLSEFRPVGNEFHMTRVSQSEPSTLVNPSPATTPIPQSSTPTLVTSNSIEHSQLGQILAQYQGETGQDPLSPDEPPSPSASPAPTNYVPRTWATTYANYPAR